MKFFDVNLRPPFVDPARIIGLAARADVIKLNDDEVGALAGWVRTGVLKPVRPATPEAGAAACGVFAEATGVTRICVTMGAAGAALWDRHAPFVHVPAPPTVVKDTVGAGDAFMAGLIVGLTHGGARADGVGVRLPPGRLRRVARGGHPAVAAGDDPGTPRQFGLGARDCRRRPGQDHVQQERRQSARADAAAENQPQRFRQRRERLRVQVHPQAEAERDRHDQHFALTEPARVRMRMPAAAIRPKSTSVNPPMTGGGTLASHRPSPGSTPKPTSSPPHTNPTRRLATPVIWMTPLFCAKVVLGKAVEHGGERAIDPVGEHARRARAASSAARSSARRKARSTPSGRQASRWP